MKKILATILVLALVAPAMAVTFTGTDLGGGKARISYDVPTGEVLRGVALNLNTTVGTATIASAAAVTAIDPKFNTFIDYAFSNPSGYAIGAGNPLALPTGAGVLTTFPASTFVLSMGALDETGAQGGVTGTGVLCEIQYTISANATIHVMADTIRGGAVVGDAVTQPTAFDIVLIGDCYTGPQYAQWVAVGKPACWCASNNPRQCKGDADGLPQGKQVYYVSTNDLAILLAAWNKPVEQLTGTQICADLDHLPQGKQNYRVSTNDLSIMLANWNIAGGPAPTCP